MTRRYPLKKYQIWIGMYDLGQGYGRPTKPELCDEIEAPDFRTACVLYELRRSLESIEGMIAKDQYVDHQSCRWHYDFNRNYNSWTGKYYESKAEAELSFFEN